MKNSRTLARLLGVMLALVLVGSSCSGDSKDAASKDGGSEAAGDQGASGNTISVPDDQPTIQKAVDAAKPGDLIMVAAGTYKEAASPSAAPIATPPSSTADSSWRTASACCPPRVSPSRT